MTNNTLAYTQLIGLANIDNYQKIKLGGKIIHII
jgi:hypothetical protein